MRPPGRVTLLTSPAAAARLAAAGDALRRGLAAGEAVAVGETRDAADELAHEVARDLGATFGLYRYSLRQLAGRIAAAELARRELAPATRLATEAVAKHAAFVEQQHRALDYLGPIAAFRSFGRVLAATLGDLRRADCDSAAAGELGGSGPDVARLARRYDRLLEEDRLVDGATLYRVAARLVRTGSGAAGASLTGALVLLDVAVTDDAACELVAALAGRAASVLATVPAGDERTLAALRHLPGAVEEVAPGSGGAPPVDRPLPRVQHFLFAPADPPPFRDAADEPAIRVFSAPGESREAVEIARVLTAEASRGVPFDRMAVLVRSPGSYIRLLETALGRAGIPAWYAKGTRVPHPAGRAFLALLACAAEQLSARRFSEYLSLGQVPSLAPDGGPPADRGRWVPPDSAPDLVPAPAQLSLFDAPSPPPADAGSAPDAPPDGDERPVLEGSLRAPFRWERLLVESAVVGGRDRWERRLEGLAREMALQVAALRADEPESPRAARLELDLANLEHLRRFALPVVARLAAFPAAALWAEWLDRLEALAPMVLAAPDRVLAVLADLRPMAAVGPVGLADVRDVLQEQLTELTAEQPGRRFGRVFVGGPEQARGRRFAVVCVPGLAEHVFPQRQRQDPLLLDELRARLDAREPGAPRLGLADRHDRNAREKLLLRLAVGAATERVVLSYPRLEVGSARPRVPSFYALDVERALTGRVPDFEQIERDAFRDVEAHLAWPAPGDPARAIDPSEHDLAVLRELLHAAPAAPLAGRARYLFRLHPALRRTLAARWVRWKRPWSKFDGLYDPGDGDAKTMLAAHRLDARAYSVSALQRFAACPYQFLLSAVHRLHPREEVEPPLERMDPLTRGSMFHEVQQEVFEALRERRALPLTAAAVAEADVVADAVLDRIAADYEERLAPAIPRVWQDEVESMRADLKGWLRHVANEGGEWMPIDAEFPFGLGPRADGPAAEAGRPRPPEADAGWDPGCAPDPAAIDGRWRLRGRVDLVEARTGPTDRGELRVTDHKTGGNRTRPGMVVGGGETLQPVLYGLAVEAVSGRPVDEARLFFCTATGRYEQRVVSLGEDERRHGVEVLEIIDRAVEAGTLLPAPREGACRWCDYQAVCGPGAEQRAARKDGAPLRDLLSLRDLR